MDDLCLIETDHKNGDGDGPPLEKPLAERDGAALAQGPLQINDAELLGEEHPDMIELLGKPITFMTGDLWDQGDRRNTKPGDWRLNTEFTWGNLITSDWSPLTVHQKSKSKQGSSIVLGETIDGNRNAESVKSLGAIVIDIDSGPTFEDVRNKLIAKGIFAVMYTSFNNKKTEVVLKHDDVVRKLKLDDTPTRTQVIEYLRLHHKDRYDDGFLDGIEVEDARRHGPKGLQIVLRTPPLHKFRVVVPLWEPVELASLGTTASQWKDAWADIVTGFVVNVLGVTFDATSCDVNRLFYTARHPKGGDWDCAVIQGRPVRAEEIEPFSKNAYIKNRAPSESLSSDSLDDRHPPQCHAPSGMVLNAWHTKAKERFLVTDLLLAEATDKVRREVSDGKVEIECPFEHQHSTEGGTGTVAMSPHTNNHGVWSVSCPHDACQGRHKLEHLEEMLKAGWFEEDCLRDEEYLLPSNENQDSENFEYTTEAVNILIKEATISKDSSEGEVMTFLRTHCGADTASKRRIENALGTTARNDGATVYTPTEIKKLWVKSEADDQHEEEESDALRMSFGFENVLEQAQEKLRDENEAHQTIFDMHGCLSALRRDALGRAKIKQLGYDGLSAEIAPYVKFEKSYDKGKTFVSAAPPTEIVKHLYQGHYTEWALPLRGLEAAPFFQKDGSLVLHDGYDPEAQVYLAAPPGLKVPQVSACPSVEEVAHAKELIDGVLHDFPFDGTPGEETASRANTIGMALQPFMREMIDGPTPVYLVNKPAPGTGAGLLLDVMSFIWTGKVATTISVPKSKEEIGKTIISKLRSGASYLMLDNIPDNLDSDFLAMAITQGSIDARILGRNDSGAVDPVEVRATWVFNGNNVTMSKELMRRAVLIELDAQVASPQDRTGWKHPKLKRYVIDNRAELVWACLTLIQNWIAKGRRAYSGPHVKGSFDEWLDCVGGVLEAAGYAHFYDNCDELLEVVADTEENGLTHLAGVLADFKPGAEFYAKDIKDILNNNGDPILIKNWGYDNDGVYANAQVVGIRFAQFAKKPQVGRRALDEGYATVEIGFDDEYDKHNKVKFYKLKMRPLGSTKWLTRVPSQDATEWATWELLNMPDQPA